MGKTVKDSKIIQFLFSNDVRTDLKINEHANKLLDLNVSIINLNN